MNQGRTQKRMLRRETHSSRTGLSVATAVLLLAGFLWLGAECALALTGRGPLVASPMPWRLPSKTCPRRCNRPR